MSRRTLAAVILTGNAAAVAGSLAADSPAWLSIVLGVLLVPVAVWTVIEFREARHGSAEG